jgi:mono/diheme cytochrome c family protein
MRHLVVAHPLRSATVALAILSFGSGHLAAAPPQQSSAPSPSSHRALLDQYCVSCHNQRAKTAGLTFDTMNLANVAQDAAVWEKAVRKLRGGMMPPPGVRRPAPAAVESFVSWLETSLDQAASAAPNPGYVTLHRLNRAEYTNAIKDLLDVDVDASALLPSDDISNGFDNIANVLKVSPSFLDQYIMAARAVTRQAVGDPPPSEPVKAILRAGTADPHETLPLGTRGGILVEHLFPADGEYEFKVTGTASILTLDGAKISPTGRIAVKAGPHKVGLTSVAHSFVESEATLQSFIPGNPGILYGVGRGAAPPSIQITGPYNPTGNRIETPNRARIFVCRPPDQSEEPSCAARILYDIAHRAFRRPVTAKDLAAPLAFFKEGRATGGFDAGIQSGLIAILASPKFLYRAEPPPENLKPGSVYRISDLELASRLSFFLWSSIPDDELLSLAEQGKLKDPKVFEQQVRRMLAAPQSRSLVTNFAFQWLKVRDIAAFDPDPFVYPGFDASLKQAFRREMELFLESIVREDRSALDLLTADYTFVNERLALHYGIPNVRGEQFRRVSLSDSNRRGLLGKGAILMVTSYPNRTAPVLRGAFILENIAGTPPAPPPPNVEAFKENKEGEKTRTVREIMEQHRANPSCNSCHGIMDPLGFAFENFDSIGAWRAKDRYARTPIDSSGQLVDGTPVNGPGDVRQALMKRPEQFVQTMTEKLLTYALGRSVDHYDMPAVRKIVRDAARDNYRFSSVVMGIVNGVPFQMGKIPEAAGPVEKTVAAR